MKTARILLFCIAIAAAPWCLRAAESDQEVAARKVALDLAGAFSNDGFKIRDGHWAGELKPGDRALIAVNLYAGNQYWFSVGATEKATKIGIELYDEAGRRLATEEYNNEDKAAVGFVATISGQYFVAISLLEGELSTCSLVYSYK